MYATWKRPPSYKILLQQTIRWSFHRKWHQNQRNTNTNQHTRSGDGHKGWKPFVTKTINDHSFYKPPRHSLCLRYPIYSPSKSFYYSTDDHYICTNLFESKRRDASSIDILQFPTLSGKGDIRKLNWFLNGENVRFHPFKRVEMHNFWYATIWFLIRRRRMTFLKAWLPHIYT